MKPCGYRGCENQETAAHCCGCGQEFEAISTDASETAEAVDGKAARQFIDLSNIDGAFAFEHGFSRPNWEVIRKHLETRVQWANRVAAWTEAAHQWAEQLERDLGGEYWVATSDDFLLLSALAPETAVNLLRFSERAHGIICDNLRDVAWNSDGKGVIIAFSDEDDYYDYIGYFYRADEIPRSGGVHIGTGYRHVAFPYHGEADAFHTIAHELTHRCLPHLPLPVWLNEGVSETLRRLIGGPQIRSEEGASSAYWAAVSGWRAPLMWDELAERHCAFWTEKNIQTFWAGTSFGQSQEAQELSYSLAEVMVHLMSGDHEGFLAFLSRAHYADAGQTAALECLGMNLGDVIANCLGEGNWRPSRKAMVQCWEAEKVKDKSETNDNSR